MKRLLPWLSAALLSGPALASPNPLAQQDALQKQFGPQVNIQLQRGTGAIKGLRGLQLSSEGLSPREAADTFLQHHHALLGLGHSRPVFSKTQGRPQGGTIVSYTMEVDGHPVEERALNVIINAQGQLDQVRIDPPITTYTAPRQRLSPEEALLALRSQADLVLVGKAQLRVLPVSPHEARLAYRFPVSNFPLAAHHFMWIDAETGAFLSQRIAGHDAPIQRLPLRQGK